MIALSDEGPMPINNDNLLSEKTIELNEPYAEWITIDEEITGNPYEDIAHAIFTHEEGENLQSLMFYDGNNSWKFRYIKNGPEKYEQTTNGLCG